MPGHTKKQPFTTADGGIDWDQVAVYYQEHTQETLASVGRLVGTSKDTVKAHLLKRKVAIRKRGLTPEQQEKLCEEYLAGVPPTQLMKKYNGAGVYQYLHKAGVKVHNPELSDQAKIEILDQYQQGISTLTLAKKYNVAQDTIRRDLRAKGVLAKRDKLSPQQFQDCIDRYQNGEEPEELAKEYEVHPHSIRTRLRKAGVPLRSQLLRPHEVEAMLRHYRPGCDLTKIGEQYGISSKGVSFHLRQSGERYQKYSLNHNAFSELTSESAYWLGFLMADGSVNDNNFVRINLAARDTHHLQKFLDFVDSSERPIYHSYRKAFGTNKGGPQAGIKFASAKMCHDLAKHGIVPRKVRITKTSSEALQCPSFWLGLLDGDGTIGIPSGRNSPVAAMLGTRRLLEQYQEFLSMHLPHERIPNLIHSAKRETPHLYNAHLHGAVAQYLLFLMYSERTSCLTRKQEKAQLAFQYRPKHSRHKLENLEVAKLQEAIEFRRQICLPETEAAILQSVDIIHQPDGEKD